MCEVCQGTDFRLIDGVHYCTRCQNQSLFMMQEMVEEGEGEAANLGAVLGVDERVERLSRRQEKEATGVVSCGDVFVDTFVKMVQIIHARCGGDRPDIFVTARQLLSNWIGQGGLFEKPTRARKGAWVVRLRSISFAVFLLNLLCRLLELPVGAVEISEMLENNEFGEIDVVREAALEQGVADVPFLDNSKMLGLVCVQRDKRIEKKVRRKSKNNQEEQEQEQEEEEEDEIIVQAFKESLRYVKIPLLLGQHIDLETYQVAVELGIEMPPITSAEMLLYPCRRLGLCVDSIPWVPLICRAALYLIHDAEKAHGLESVNISAALSACVIRSLKLSPEYMMRLSEFLSEFRALDKSTIMTRLATLSTRPILHTIEGFVTKDVNPRDAELERRRDLEPPLKSYVFSEDQQPSFDAFDPDDIPSDLMVILCATTLICKCRLDIVTRKMILIERRFDGKKGSGGKKPL